VYDDVDRPVLVGEDEGGKLGVHDLTGMITVRNSHGAHNALKCEVKKRDLLIHAEK